MSGGTWGGAVRCRLIRRAAVCCQARLHPECAARFLKRAGSRKVLDHEVPVGYERHVDAEKHVIGKEHMQKIESKHINLRTRIKRLVRRTICFSKSEYMHDLVIGLFVNRYEFGRAI